LTKLEKIAATTFHFGCTGRAPVVIMATRAAPPALRKASSKEALASGARGSAPPPLRKAASKEEKLHNDDGVPVFPGTARFAHIRGGGGRGKYYCGRKMGAAVIPGSDGRCGPNGGPQCPSCRRFQAVAAPTMKAMKVAPALPARGAMLMKAMKGPAKKAPKAMAAAPARGGALVKTKGKAKAVAAKSFAAVAAKLKKSASKASLAGSGTWYFMKDLRKMKVGTDDEKAWQKFDSKMNKQLEMAHSKGFSQYTMKLGDKQYIVKFKSMMQFRADDKTLQRPVKRE